MVRAGTPNSNICTASRGEEFMVLVKIVVDTGIGQLTPCQAKDSETLC